MLYIEVLNTGIYIGKQNQENILLNWLSFYENQSRHIYLYHDILDVKKGRALVLHRKNVIYSSDVKKAIIFKINIKTGAIKKNS